MARKGQVPSRSYGTKGGSSDSMAFDFDSHFNFDLFGDSSTDTTFIKTRLLIFLNIKSETPRYRHLDIVQP